MSWKKRIVVVILVIVFGFIVGWWLLGLLRPLKESPVVKDAAAPPLPNVTTGYCCVTPGQSCVKTDTASVCFRQQGKGFNSRQAVCDRFCVAIGS
ncbi:hypothetical protein A3H22_00990 [Candidatus Peribacteria bacterium RIFCSPLOWO2_12_FULL_55_15]|nr:MAG: hypothetical protein A2789_00750 [Candidatus Peribacteria bacterium RIFCSPHIGHO2_01_FULL_54_22]OGJ68871.1 MAG: hypothetical protein A2947_03785 [Candidatus Peribacteria bacterium RIFCSPLOWO2_01_FULL_54_110]OGJ70221.1 MAG: hypothetical protein A3H22_00990 [Candidatus Peribacteria bacterium RIFCSPLOWO2_12_FULL_55_15]